LIVLSSIAHVLFMHFERNSDTKNMKGITND
jgi:hypothetical protein